MSRIVAENRFTLTKELFYEGAKRVSKENYAPFAKKAMLWIAAAWAVMAFVTLLLRQSPLYIAFEAVVLGLVCLWLAVYMPWHKRRRAYNKLTEQYGEDMERTAVFYENALRVNVSGRELEFEYGSIVKILSSERMLILLTSGSKAIMAAKNGFTVGSESDIYKAIEDYNNVT